MIFWNGKSSDRYNVVVEHYPTRPLPKRKVDVVSIPGRNGDLLFSQDAYENVVQEYDIYISAEQLKLPITARRVAEWLLQPGYNRLFDSYEPEVFRLAYYNGTQDIANIMNRFGKLTISFSCKPQRFLITGEDEQTFSAPGTIINPTFCIAKPLITVLGSGDGTLNVGGTTVSLSDISEYITLDCDLQDAYKGLVNENAKVTGEFPTLEGGENVVSWTGDITGVKITPRWWML